MVRITGYRFVTKIFHSIALVGLGLKTPGYFAGVTPRGYPGCFVVRIEALTG